MQIISPGKNRVVVNCQFHKLKEVLVGGVDCVLFQYHIRFAENYAQEQDKLLTLQLQCRSCKFHNNSFIN